MIFFLARKQDLAGTKHEPDNLIKAFSDLSLPLAEDKVIGPAKNIVYLCIEKDSNDLSISILPQSKFNELLEALPAWCNKRSCTKQIFLSLIGKLSFVCKVVHTGRIFLH